jgi:hypothetical protein
LKNETKENTRRWKDPYLWINRMNSAKLAIILKAIYRFNAIPIKISMSFCHRNRKIKNKIQLEAQKTPKVKTILSKKQYW